MSNSTLAHPKRPSLSEEASTLSHQLRVLHFGSEAFTSSRGSTTRRAGPFRRGSQPALVGYPSEDGEFARNRDVVTNVDRKLLVP